MCTLPVKFDVPFPTVPLLPPDEVIIYVRMDWFGPLLYENGFYMNLLEQDQI